MNEQLDNKVVRELLTCFRDRNEAESLLTRAGFPIERLPAHLSAEQLWVFVQQEYNAGAGDPRAVVEQAAGRYPRNREFREWLAAAAPTPIAVPRPAAPKSASSAPGVAFFAANPLTTNRLLLDQEYNAIERVLRDGIDDGSLRLHPYFSVQRDELTDLLRKFRPAVAHFSGHGSEDGSLQLSYAGGRIAEVINPSGLRRIFRMVNDDDTVVRCVVLNACHSAAAAEKLTQVVDLCVGADNRISDIAGQTFSRGFYGALLDGLSFQAAVTAGKQMMQEFCDGQYDAEVRKACDPALIQYRARDGIDPNKMFLLK